MNTPHAEPAPESQQNENDSSSPPNSPRTENNSQNSPAARVVEISNAAAQLAVAPDLRTPLRGLDLALLVPFYFVTGTLLYLMVAAVAHYVFGSPFTDFRGSSATKASAVIISQALLSGATLAFLWVLVRARSAAPFWRSVGWRRFTGKDSYPGIVIRYLFGGVVLATVTALAGRYLDKGLTVPMDELFRNRQSVLLMMGVGILIAPAVEETIFRGCIYPILARRIGIWAGVLTTGLLFGLVHAPQLWPGFGQITLMICVGILLTYTRARAGTVAASFFVHLGYNSVVLIGYYLATGGLRHLPS